MRRGRSQVVSLSFLFVTRFFSAELPTVATLPSALFDERVFSLGASWVFSFQPVLPPDCRPVGHSFLLGRATDCRHPSNRTLGFASFYERDQLAALVSACPAL